MLDSRSLELAKLCVVNKMLVIYVVKKVKKAIRQYRLLTEVTGKRAKKIKQMMGLA